MDQRIKVANHVVKYGGQLIFETFHTSLAVREKTRHDYVTEVDEEIETLFEHEIKRVFPDDAILGEEHGSTDGGSGYLWVIDPLDGTNNFVKGVPQAGIQIAIYKDNEIFYAAVFNPFVNQLYTSQKGQGAHLEDFNKGYTSALTVSETSLYDSMMIFDSSIANGDHPELDIFNAFMGNIGWLRIFGVAVLDLPLIALGSADILISNIPKPMDIAPGCLLIQEAGGVITDFDGKPWTLHSKNIIAGNKSNHPEALKIVQDRLSSFDSNPTK
jgi:myo-inositol-1(or 4)-monophosphatase